QPDQAYVERVVERLGEAGERDFAAPAVAQPTLPQLLHQGVQVVPSGCIQFERFAHQVCPVGVEVLCFRLALVDIAERWRQGKEALLEATIEPFAGLLSKIANVVRGNHGLNVGRETAAPRAEVQTLVDELNLNAAVDKFTEVRPIFEVASATVDFVNNHTV